MSPLKGHPGIPVKRKQSVAVADRAETSYEMALARMERLFSLFDHVAVAFSGGKDSTAVLNVATTVSAKLGKGPVTAHFYDEEAIPYQTEEYVRRVSQRDDVNLEWYCIPLKNNNACSAGNPIWFPWAPEDEDKWCRPLPPEARTELSGFPIWPAHARFSHMDGVDALHYRNRKGEQCCTLLGIRAAESLTRYRAVNRREHGEDNYIFKQHAVVPNPGNAWQAYPIYDWSTTDVWTAPAKFGWDYNCNPAEAPIWMGDFSFKPIEDVRPDDKVIGWEKADVKHGKDRLVRTKVVRIFSKMQPVVKVTLASGRTLRCTADHQWLTVGNHQNNHRFAPATVGTNLCHVVDPVDRNDLEAERRELGSWLAGMYDGEGSYDRIYQRPGELQEAIGSALVTLEIPAARLNGNSAAQHGWRITGGRAGLIRFLNLTKPIRVDQFDSLVLGARFRAPDEVVSVEPDGEEPVFALETETGNYVAWGYASKNSAYDVMEMAGVGHSSQRCSPAFANEPLQKLHTYQTCFPEIWDKMLERVPGVGSAARYALTELYAYRGTPPKPDGLPWISFVSGFLVRQGADRQDQTRTQIMTIIRSHYANTQDPIMPDSAHPETGLSWRFCVMLAMRGDPNNRKQPGMKVSTDPEKRKIQWDKYDKERAGLTAEQLAECKPW